MNPIRFVLAIGSIVLIDLSVMNVLLWHAFYWVPIGYYSLWLLAVALFEVRRYRPNVNRASTTWRATNETFIDPASGERTTVYYDPVSGKRDYRIG